MSGKERFVVKYQDMNRVRAEAAEEGWTEGEHLFDYVDKIAAGLRYKKADNLQDAIEKARRLHGEDHVEDYPIIRRQIVESEVDVGDGAILSVPPEWVTADIWYLTEDGVEKG